MPVGARYRLVLCGSLSSPSSVLYTDLLMHFLPHNIENMLGFFLVLELEGLVLVLESLGTNFFSRHARLIINSQWRLSRIFQNLAAMILSLQVQFPMTLNALCVS